MHLRRWVWGKFARPERDQALKTFITMRPQTQVLGELSAHLDFVVLTGKHPEELPRRRGVRAFPAGVYEGVTSLALYLLFAVVEDKFVVLHVSLAERSGAAQKPAGSRPPLSDDAWDLAQTRLSAGLY
jgi:hypothetical protein